MTVEFFDPRCTPRMAPEPYDQALNSTESAPAIGLLANTYPDAVRFLQLLEGALRGTWPDVQIRQYQKDDLTPVTEELREMIAAECSAVVGAYGH